ncbi:MAG: ABC transporter ATP-binding protein [Cardiobacteriaceae bacterium]|nr:ABC transporter ATP-binding protein [Cardiobacteriaceae bacterium]
MSAVIEVKNLHFSYGQRVILDNVSFKVEENELIGVMGPSGTGKTTLMRLITGQLKPDRGEIWVLGEPVHQLSQSALMRLRQQMSMLFQSGALFAELNVFDNVAFPLRELTKLDERVIQALVLMKLEQVGLRGASALMPNELSGGMARRVALARALALDPRVMIYDEPFTGQDPISMGVLVKLVKEANMGLNMTSLIVSHDVAEVASIADKILLLSGAQLIAFDTPKALYHSNNPAIEQFMHALPEGAMPFHYPAPDYQSALLGSPLAKKSKGNS